jgi:hypothetical protein
MANQTLKTIAAKYEVPEDQIQVILNELSIKADKPTEVQLKGFEQVCDLIKKGTPLVQAAQTVAAEAKAKTTAKDNPEAAQTVTTAECKTQLQEIAVRYAIPNERIPEILGAMKLKLETLTEVQVPLFQDVCQMLQSGMDLAMASQAMAAKAKEQAKAAAKTKAAAKKFPEFTQDTADAEHPPEQSTAIAPAKDNPMPELVVREVESVPPDAREQIDEVARAVGPSAVPDFVEVVTDEASAVDQGIRQYARHALFKAIAENPRPQSTPEEAVELFKKKQAERLAQRYGQ